MGRGAVERTEPKSKNRGFGPTPQQWKLETPDSGNQSHQRKLVAFFIVCQITKIIRNTF